MNSQPTVTGTGMEHDGKKGEMSKLLKVLERAMGFEPTTTCLGSKDSTTELRPLVASNPTPGL
jgi:hypothetical protein